MGACTMGGGGAREILSARAPRRGVMALTSSYPDDAWLREYIAAARKSSPRDLTGDRAVDGCPHYPAPALEDLNDHEALLKEATYSKMKLHEVWDMCYYIGVCTDPL